MRDPLTYALARNAFVLGGMVAGLWTYQYWGRSWWGPFLGLGIGIVIGAAASVFAHWMASDSRHRK